MRVSPVACGWHLTYQISASFSQTPSYKSTERGGMEGLVFMCFFLCLLSFNYGVVCPFHWRRWLEKYQRSAGKFAVSEEPREKANWKRKYSATSLSKQTVIIFISAETQPHLSYCFFFFLGYLYYNNSSNSHPQSPERSNGVSKLPLGLRNESHQFMPVYVEIWCARSEY